MKGYPYYTALKGTRLLPRGREADRVVTRCGVVFRHDILSALTLPPEYDQCDALYAEPPWRQGYNVFYEREGRQPPQPYSIFQAHIAYLLFGDGRPSDRPAVLIVGEEMRREANIAGRVPVRLRGARTLAYMNEPARRMLNVKDGVESASLIAQIAEACACVGDPFCGYGRTGRIAGQAGKRFVLSDQSGHCVAEAGRLLLLAGL